MGSDTVKSKEMEQITASKDIKLHPMPEPKIVAKTKVPTTP